MITKCSLVLGVVLLFASCSKDDDQPTAAKPSISITEIGSGNSKTAYAGSDLHLDAEVVAPGTIASITVDIHAEGSSPWHFDSVYTEGFAGQKNANFHKHIDIPENATPGHYHIHFTVKDQLGQETEMEAELEIRVDATLPTLGELEVSPNTAGTDLHLDAEINAPNKIAKVVVEIHGGSYENEVEYTDAAMVGQTSYHFHKHIDISAAPAGHYHVHIKVIDQANKEREFEDHFDKK